ncbi:MAG TPA: glucuronyl hydrolase, partial [Hanamia sp.]|nr:glucuronyl hydrolase [Hanamia sp.]
MKKISFGFLLLLMMTAAHAQTSASKNTMRNLIKENFAFADTQYRYMMTLTPPDKLPQSYDAKNDKFIARNIGWWCTGFYPGSLLYIYEQTKDETLKQEAERALKLIEPNKFDTGTHDLGFMMFCSF